MASLKEVKNRIGSVISTQQITKAMKMVAAAKLRRSQEKVLQMRPFAQKLTAILQNLSTSDGAEPGWYNKVRPERNILMIVISSLLTRSTARSDSKELLPSYLSASAGWIISGSATSRWTRRL